MSKEMRENIEKVKNWKQFLNESISTICQNCGGKDSFPTIEQVKKRGWGSPKWCSYCAKEQIEVDFYDVRTNELSDEFFEKFVKGKDDSHKIKYNIRKIEGNYIFELIDIVIRKEKEKGLGTELMKKIIDFCDKNKLKIELRASDFYGSSIDRLISFYKKFGFVEGNDINQMGHLMQRNPK